MSAIHRFVWCTYLIIAIGFVDSLLTSSTIRTVAVTNSSVTFSCRTNSSKRIRWHYLSHLTNSWKIIYNGMKFIEQLEDRYAENFNTLTKQSDLTIVKLQLADAGVYGCMEVGTTAHNIDFNLTVLESVPVCQTNVSIPGSVSIDDYIQVTCSVNVSGSSSPTIRCNSSLPAHNVIRITSSRPAAAVRYSAVARVVRPVADPVFQCTVTFSSASSTTSDDHSGKPDYKFTWTSPDIAIEGCISSPPDYHLSTEYETASPGDVSRMTFIVATSAILAFFLVLAFTVGVNIAVFRKHQSQTGTKNYDCNTPKERSNSLTIHPNDNVVADANTRRSSRDSLNSPIGYNGRQYAEVNDTQLPNVSRPTAATDGTVMYDVKAPYERLEPHTETLLTMDASAALYSELADTGDRLDL